MVPYFAHKKFQFVPPSAANGANSVTGR